MVKISVYYVPLNLSQRHNNHFTIINEHFDYEFLHSLDIKITSFTRLPRVIKIVFFLGFFSTVGLMNDS